MSVNQTQSYFNQRAANWDRHAHYDPCKIQTMLRLCNITPQSVMLDVGCGTGLLEEYLLAYKPTKIWAVDFAENMIVAAQKKFSHPDISFIHADIFNIFDIVCDYCFFYNAFPHFNEPKRLIQHIATLIRPGGRLMISHSSGKRHTLVDRADYASALLPAQGLIKLLQPYFFLDILVDTDYMVLVSGIRLSDHTHKEDAH